jgi:hypothetical protein
MCVCVPASWLKAMLVTLDAQAIVKYTSTDKDSGAVHVIKVAGHDQHIVLLDVLELLHNGLTLIYMYV